MNIQPDFEKLLTLLEKQKVDYMIVGGYAVAFHGYPRFTNDIDVFFDPTTENIGRLRSALKEFGFYEKDLSNDIFSKKGNIITFGAAPVRVDFVNETDGVTYAEAKDNIVRGKYGNTSVNFIGLEELIRNKSAMKRTKDKADIEELT